MGEIERIGGIGQGRGRGNGKRRRNGRERIFYCLLVLLIHGTFAPILKKMGENICFYYCYYHTNGEIKIYIAICP